jgi:iron complex transport system substrate-binding protein
MPQGEGQTPRPQDFLLLVAAEATGCSVSQEVSENKKELITILRALLTTLMFAVVLAVPQAADAKRIVALNGDITEIIFALGAEDQLVAVDATSVYPEAAQELPNVGYQGRLSAEGIMAFEPTHVIANSGARPLEVLDQLAAAGVEVVFTADHDSLDTPVQNIRLIAELIGAEELGEELALEVEKKITAAAQRGSELASSPRILFLYLGSTQMQFAGGAETSSNVMIEAAGGIDAGAEIGFVGNVPFTPEALVTAQPDVLIVTDRGINVVGGVEGVLAIPGIAQTPAGINGKVIVFEDLYFLGMGPRSGDALMELVDQLHDLQ